MNNRAFLNVRLISFCASVLLVGVFSAPLHAQSDGTELMTDLKVRSAIQLVLKNTSAKGVPIDPLIRKVHEGVAKKSDPARIESAVESLARRLETSFAALAPSRSVEELSAGAEALQVGVPATTLRDLRKVWMNKPLTVPLGILYELVSREVPLSQATKRVRELMSKGASDSQLIVLIANVVADVDAGLAPGAALELRSKGVMSLLSHPVQTFQSAAPLAPLTPATGAPAKPPIRPK